MTDFVAHNNLTIIPARGGSKRVPGKNKKLLQGKPLIAWTIEAALNAPSSGQVVVSTDDPEIAEIALEYGATVPGLRPAHLATDEATTRDVILDCVQTLQRQGEAAVEWITLLQPTSPFRGANLIAEAVELFRCKEGNTVVSVAPSPVPQQWMLTLKDGDTIEDCGYPEAETELFYYCGSVYVFTRQTLETTGDLYSDDVVALVVRDSVAAVDIDTPEDWRMAELIAKGLAAS